MKKTLVSSFIAASALVSIAQAATTNADLQAQISKINAQTKRLQAQVRALQAQLDQRGRSKTASGKKSQNGDWRSPVPSNGALRYHEMQTVVTSPFIGLKTDYMPLDLLYWEPSMNQDLLLLQQRQQLQNLLKAHKIPFDRPILELSGAVESQLYGAWGFNVPPGDKGINLSNVEIMMNAAVSRWATAYATFNFNNAPVSSGSRQPRGIVYVNRAFLTIGNLNASPFYFTFGEYYPPFGRYSSGMITTPLTSSLGKIRSATALLGYFNNGFNVNAFMYNGNQVSPSGHAMMQFGGHLGYNEQFRKKKSIDVDVSAVSNVADSLGMQNNGVSPFPPGSGGGTAQTNFSGFGVNTRATGVTANTLAHRVPGIDASATLGWGAMSYIIEYTAAAESFAAADMTFNGAGAKPQAVHAEIDYNTRLWNRPFIFGAAYGHSWEALALNIPQDSYSAFVSFSVWKDTLEAIEFRHDDDYGSGDRATGGGVPAGIGPGLSGTGRGRNSVIAQIGVYF